MVNSGQDMSATVSVVVPFYNLKRYVRECLDSVMAAARGHMEVICVDDGSADGTGELLDEYAATPGLPAAVRVIHQANGGEGAARNAGVAASTGKWVTFLDGDDVWLGNHMDVALPLLSDYPDADIVALGFAQFDDGAQPPEPSAAAARAFDVESVVPSEILLDVGVYPTFFRREFAAEGEFSVLPLGADRLYVAQCLARAHSVVKCDAVVHGYRIRAGSMARAVWNGRKVSSQCDYAFGSLEALASSGKGIGLEGLGYLASLWLSDVPNRLARLPREERRIAWERWRGTLGSNCVRASRRYDFVRSVICRCSSSQWLSLAVARLFRKLGVS